MRVFIIWEKYFNYLDSIEAAFRTNGCETTTYTMKRFKKNTSQLKKIISKLGYKGFAKDYKKRVSRDILNQCLDFKPDLFLMINGNFTELITEDIIMEIKRSGANMALWFIDSAQRYGTSKNYLDMYDNVWSFERSDINFIETAYGKKVRYLPVGADDNIYKRMYCSEKIYDICFVGSKDKRRLETLETVAKYCNENGKKMKVYGYLWKNRDWVQSTIFGSYFRIKYPNLYKYSVNERIEPNKTAELYNLSKINLNITISQHKSTNPRTFEIMATGGFQLVDYHDGCEQIFGNKKDLVWYKDNQELIELIDYYLKFDSERETIANSGYKVVHDKYLMKHIIKQIMEG